MASLKVSIPQVADDETVEAIDAFLSYLHGWVLVYGNVENKSMRLHVGGYRQNGQTPLVRDHDPNRPDEDFRRTHYNSMTFEFECEGEARELHERFG